jgi:hypothetical protein
VKVSAGRAFVPRDRGAAGVKLVRIIHMSGLQK